MTEPDDDRSVGFEGAAYQADFEARLRDMRRLLEAMRPDTDAMALKALRDHFPDAALAERIAAVSGSRSRP
jgi:hypothetical protein